MSYLPIIMNYSKYNTFVKDGDRTLIFNALSGAFLGVPNQQLEALEQGENPALEETLLKQGILTEEKEEIVKYKYLYYKQMFHDKSLSVTIAPTMQCNLCCPYCFEGGNKHAVYMGEEVMDALVEFFKKNAQKKIYITWFGGEPLLAFEQIVRLNGKLRNEGIRYTSSLITNGTLLTPEKYGAFGPLNLGHIQITLDGIGRQHDSKRFFKPGKGSFDTILENIDHVLKETSVNLYLQVNVDKVNPRAYEEAFELLFSKYPDFVKSGRLRIGCNHIRNRTDFKGCGNCYDLDEEFEMRKRHAALAGGAQRPFQIPPKTMPCPLRSAAAYVIGPEGDIYKCLEFLGDPSKKIGNIVDHEISLKKVAVLALSNDPFTDRECLECPIFPICGGGCPVDRMKRQENKNISTCPYYKQYLPQVLKEVYQNMKK